MKFRTANYWDLMATFDACGFRFHAIGRMFEADGRKAFALYRGDKLTDEMRKILRRTVPGVEFGKAASEYAPERRSAVVMVPLRSRLDAMAAEVQEKGELPVSWLEEGRRYMVAFWDASKGAPREGSRWRYATFRRAGPSSDDKGYWPSMVLRECLENRSGHSWPIIPNELAVKTHPKGKALPLKMDVSAL